MAKEMIVDDITYRIPEPGSLIDFLFENNDCFHRPMFEIIESEDGYMPARSRMDCRYTVDEEIWIKAGDVVFKETGEYAE